MLVLFGGWFLTRTELIGRHGWLMIFPTTAIMAAAPSSGGPDTAFGQTALGLLGYNQTSAWQRRMFYSLMDDPAVTVKIITRKDWPRDIPFAARLDVSGDMTDWTWESGIKTVATPQIAGWSAIRTGPMRLITTDSIRFYRDRLGVLGDLKPEKAGATALPFDVRITGLRDEHVIDHFQMTVMIDVKETLDDVLKPRRDDALTTVLMDNLHIEEFSRRYIDVRLRDQQAVSAAFGDVAIGLHLQFIAEGHPTLALPVFIDPQYARWETRGKGYEITDTTDDGFVIPARDYTLIVKPDPEMALRALDATEYWAGSFEIPGEVWAGDGSP